MAWDPLNEFVATQSSDKSVHIYALKNKDGEPTLQQHNSVTRMDLPARRISANNSQSNDGSRPIHHTDPSSLPPVSPAPSASIPGTPTSLALPMNPPVMSHSRRSSFSSSSGIRRSASPAPSMPLPAVRPMEHSPVPYTALMYKNQSIYANETCTSFFRRLTFAPDGSLLFTPAGQYKIPHATPDGVKQPDEILNTVYIYTRAGLNKPPVTHLPGHKKPSVAVKCSPVLYNLRQGPRGKPVHITLDTSSADEAIPALPEPVVPTATPSTSMDPPKSADKMSFSHVTMPSPKDTGKPYASPKEPEAATTHPGPFSLPYRMIYAVATQDAVLVYDTQHNGPFCTVSNLHYATFTDLSW